MTTPTEAVAVLNRALESDPDAVRKLFCHRVECNEALAKDPTIQACAARESEPATVSVLGLINGIFGVDANQWGHIAAVYNLRCQIHGEGLPEHEGLRVGDKCPVGDCARPGDDWRSGLELGSLVRFEELKT